MLVQTKFESTAVSHSLWRKYPDDYATSLGNKAKNHFVDPQECRTRDAAPHTPERARFPLQQPSQMQDEDTVERQQSTEIVNLNLMSPRMTMTLLI